MSKSVNSVQLLGNVGNDPEHRVTNSGTDVTKISLATSRYREDETDWHRVTFFGKLAQVVRTYVCKGDRIYVAGRIEYSTTEHDGVKRYWTDMGRIASQISVRELLVVEVMGALLFIPGSSSIR